MNAVLEKVQRADNRMKHRNGPKLVYAEIFDSLNDEQLYSVYLIRKFAVNNGLLKPGSDDPPDISTKKLEERLRCILGRARSATYNGRRLPKPDGLVRDRGKIEDAWLGATVKAYLLDQWPKEQERLEKIRRKYLVRKEKGKIASWIKRPRVWINVAAFLALACTTQPGQDIIRTMITEGVAAARELAYSTPARTPDAFLQQGWVDYRAGEYESAAQKVYTILSNEDANDHTRANCWYLLGSVDWENGQNDAAMVNFRKAHDLYEAGGDLPNLYNATIAMTRADLALGNLDIAGDRLHAVLSIYNEAASGAIVPDLGDYHAVATRVAAAQHDFETALEHAKQRHAIYLRASSQLDRVAAAKSELAFWYAANGCVGKAQVLTVEASRIIFRLKDETRHIYNDLNWILIHRLQGHKSDSTAVGSIKEWAKARGDSRVEDLLALALTLEPTKEYADELCFETADQE